MCQNFDTTEIHLRRIFHAPLLDEFGQTSRESFEFEVVSNESLDVCLKSSKSGVWFFLLRCFFWCQMFDTTEIHLRRIFHTPLLGEFGQTSRESFEFEVVSNESRDVCLKSSKSGVCIFLLRCICCVSKFWHNRNTPSKNLSYATFGRIRTNVPGIVRIWSSFERILGRLS